MGKPEIRKELPNLPGDRVACFSEAKSPHDKTLLNHPSPPLSRARDRPAKTPIEAILCSIQ